jgi:Alpha galactosidase A/Alpha galactosidase C-terminal beta sandwich domain
MGWSTWSSATGNVNETIVKAAADVVASKLASYGYQYVNIDDGWYGGFDTYGRWKPDTNKFPSGFKGVADYVHSKGIKIGIYLLPGVNDTVITANSPIEGTSYHVKDIVTSASGNTSNAAGATARKIDFTKPGAVEYVQGYANHQQVWYAKQSDGSIVVGLFNLDTTSMQVTASFSAVGAGSSMKVRDLVSHTDLGTSSSSFSATLPAHGSRLVKLTP